MKKIQAIEEIQIARALEIRKSKSETGTSTVPTFRSGDTVVVAVRVIEGEKERVQNYQGIVIARRGSGINATFRVRKVSNGVGVERIFPLYAPIIQSIEVLRQGSARRSKLYYLRGMSEKKIRAKLS